ncbi:tail fiber protein [Roseovarius mucosus]|uniref:phage tail protein n=1 Tax=Roseovarius mucosus TaxID=215743 RepID=UPI001C60095E|nr:tail fiber protein [Roseovarius mucosus]MBW4973021.1 tail fiber protein [Roseovarius mucosus]
MTHLKTKSRDALMAIGLGIAACAAPQAALADADPYVGEIAPMGIVNFCPTGWAETNGQLLAISENSALFALIGTTFGGDGNVSFGLPDLRGRIPVGQGTGTGLSPRSWGQSSGQQTVTLTTSQLAAHSHAVNATNSDGNFPGPGGKILAAAPDGGSGQETIYSDQPANVQMSPQMIVPSGGNQPVTVQDPTQVIRYCIALEGVFPSRS